MFPILLNLSGKRAVVVGGGAVGARKASAVLSSGARVEVIDPRAELSLPTGVAHIREPYRAAHLDGAVLAFACATPDVNAQVVSDARAAGVWVNAASDPGEGDFALPAVVRRGEFLLAVGTGGASPGLARRMREKLESEYDDAFGLWVQLLGELRVEVLAAVPDPERRRALLDGFADWRWLALVRAEGVDVARAAMRAALAG